MAEVYKNGPIEVDFTVYEVMTFVHTFANMVLAPGCLIKQMIN